MGALNAIVQRISGTHYVTVGAGDLVQPGETIRVLATGIGYFVDSVEIVITGPGGEYLRQDVGTGIYSNRAYLDLGAPQREGSYEVTVRSKQIGTSYAKTRFTVSKDAPEPPDEPPSTGLPSFGDIKGLLIIGGIVIGAVIVLPALVRK